MGTISDKLMRIINTKEDIRQALILKGYDVPTSIPFKEYAKMISDLPCKVDDFPKLPGDVIRWHFGGLTNEMMAAMDDPRIEDADGKGRFLSFKNFAWGGMSGVGGYEMNFNLWTNNVPSIPDISMSTTTTSVSVSVGNSTYNNNLIYIHMNNWDINKNHWLKVTSTYEDGDLVFKFYNDNNSKNIELPANGYVNIPAYPEFKGNYMYISTTSNKQGSFTIEQLPLYPGFILGDGVDDFAVTEKELNFEDTYTVYTAFVPFQDDPARNMILCGKNDTKDFSINYSGTHLNFKPSTGVNLVVRVDQFALLVCKRNKDITTIINLSTGESRSLKSVEFIANPGLYYLWRNVFATFHAKAAIAGQTICNGYFSTDEDDEKVLDWYKKQYPWLFFDQAWTVTGKSNEDTDRATIKNITGNGNNLVLSNLGFAEGSGYGLYKLNFNNWFANSGSGNVNIVNVVNPHKIVLEQSQEAVGAFFLGKNVSYSGELKISVSNKPSDIELSFGSTALGKVILNEGINIVKINPVNTSIGFFTNKAFEAQNIIIEQIPEYEGYLVTDGVDDSGRAVGLTISKDFTLVGEWILFSKTQVNAGLSIHPQIHIFNRPEAIKITFRTAGKTLPVKSLKVICSDGRCYDENWNEFKINVGESISSNGILYVASNGTYRAQIAFKNLGIYNDQIFSKDDCIKAYNYLQTLKSK